ncbi:MAG: nucleotide sugar dehydrogenase [Oscillibacter sp.]|nr:nucleotide sugar dehydrogenase [Oscillibacter sp.]
MNTIKIAVIGLGYVGLPLARLFATKYPTIGFDLNQKRVEELNKGIDSTLEVENEKLKAVLIKEFSNQKSGLICTTFQEDLHEANVYIVAVPTPVDRNNRPDLNPLVKASEIVGQTIHPGDIVIYESTVYPGVTEEECIPVIEKTSGLKFNTDFYAGYSPERINPGDKEHTVEKIKKVTSGSTPEIADFVDRLYNSVLINGTHKAPSIRVAEASKIIENSQRDVNIAFMNELAKIFNAMGIDTHEVIEAAASKWNFIKLNPGLVGGHCIGVDPYYLIQKAQVYGVLPRIMSAARRLNDGMGDYVANQVIKLMNKKGILVKDAHILILGITFKENCPDVRNTKIIDIYHTLKEYTGNISIYDPWADPIRVKHEYGVNLTTDDVPDLQQKYDAVILAVAHKAFMDLDIRGLLRKENGVVYDVKGVLDRDVTDGRL